MSRHALYVHPVNGHPVKGAKQILSCLPHYDLPGLNTDLLNDIKNSDEAVQYYSAPNRFNLPVPCITFTDIQSSNICFIGYNDQCRRNRSVCKARVKAGPHVLIQQRESHINNIYFPNNIFSILGKKVSIKKSYRKYILGKKISHVI